MAVPAPWTDDEISKARSMWNAGKTAAEIASEMGRTRNSVIGIAHRQKFPPRAVLLNCSSCGQGKPAAEFRFRKDKQRHVTKCRECEREYQRQWYWANPERGRAKAAKSMRKLRADPARREALLEKQRAYYHARGKHTERAYYERIKTTDPWGWRVRNLRRNVNPAITVEWLRSLWDAQSGRCALTGRDLDIATAELDHIVPRSRSGTDDLENLRLVMPEANAAKGGMTDAELIALCRDVLTNAQIPELIGRAILEARAAA